MSEKGEIKAQQIVSVLKATLDDIKIALNIKGADKDKVFEEYFFPIKQEFNLNDIFYDGKTLKLYFNSKIKPSYKAATQIQKFLTQKEKEKGKMEIKKDEYFKVSVSKGEIKMYENYLEIKQELISDPSQHEIIAFVIDELGYLSHVQ